MIATQKKAPSGRWVLWSLISFFGVIFIANGFLLYFALNTWTGLSTKDAFKKGLAYNERLAEADAQAALGWELDLTLPNQVGAADRLSLTIADKTGKPLQGAVVQARLVRPTHEGFDRDLALTEQDQGRYSGTVEVPLPGLWEIRLQIARRDDVYRHSQRFQIRP